MLPSATRGLLLVVLLVAAGAACAKGGDGGAACGDGLVVYVASYDLHDSLILHGCADGVSVEEGETTVVVIDLYEL